MVMKLRPQNPYHQLLLARHANTLNVHTLLCFIRFNIQKLQKLMIVAPTQVINRDELFNVIEESRKLASPIKGLKGQHVVIAQGFSGVGKSSMILTLSGEDMVGYHHAESKVPILMSKNKEGRDGIKIEKQILAGTIRPACASMDRRRFKEEVTLWDMPGIGQNRGLTQSLINSYYCMKIFEAQHAMKIALIMTHSDINFGNKGISLANVFGDFMNIFGDIQPYQKSIFVVITKAPKIFKKEDALKSFAKIKNLPSVKDNPQIYKLVTMLSEDTIPILIFHDPNLRSSYVSEQNAVQATAYYQDFVDQFYNIAVTLQASNSLNLKSSAMSSQEMHKCLGFARQIQEQMRKSTAQLCDGLVEFIQDCPQIPPSLPEIRQKIAYINRMRTFVGQLMLIIDTNQHERKGNLKEKLYQLNKLLVQYSITTLNPQRLDVCPCIESLNHHFVLINFFNYLNFHKNNGYQWIEQVSAMKNLFQKLNMLEIDRIWKNEVEADFKLQITRIINLSFQDHLDQWAQSDIYLIWRNIYRIFPSFSLQLSKYLTSRINQKETYVKNFFEEMKSIQDKIGFRSSHVQKIYDILQENSLIQLELDEQLVTKKFLPMLEQRQKQLIKKVVHYQQWSQQFVEQVLDGYCETNKSYERRRNKKRQIIEEKIGEQQADQTRIQHFCKAVRHKNSDLDATQEKERFEKKIRQLEACVKENQEKLIRANNKIQIQQSQVNRLNSQLFTKRSSQQKLLKALKKAKKYKKLLIFVTFLFFCIWIISNKSQKAEQIHRPVMSCSSLKTQMKEKKCTSSLGPLHCFW